jgi:hypothetical protein
VVSTAAGVAADLVGGDGVVRGAGAAFQTGWVATPTELIATPGVLNVGVAGTGYGKA